MLKMHCMQPRAAVEEGVVPGGGTALVRCLDAVAKTAGDNQDQETGIRIVLRSMEEPLRQIVSNAGDDASVILNEVKGNSGAYGYNAGTAEYGDMLEMGIPGSNQGNARCAAKCRFDLLVFLITTEAMISEVPEDKPAAPAMPDMGGMGGMGGMM